MRTVGDIPEELRRLQVRETLAELLTHGRRLRMAIIATAAPAIGFRRPDEIASAQVKRVLGDPGREEGKPERWAKEANERETERRNNPSLACT
jgi:hypothetical protein